MSSLAVQETCAGRDRVAPQLQGCAGVLAVPVHCRQLLTPGCCCLADGHRGVGTDACCVAMMILIAAAGLGGMIRVCSAVGGDVRPSICNSKREKREHLAVHNVVATRTAVVTGSVLPGFECNI